MSSSNASTCINRFVLATVHFLDMECWSAPRLFTNLRATSELETKFFFVLGIYRSNLVLWTKGFCFEFPYFGNKIGWPLFLRTLARLYTTFIICKSSTGLLCLMNCEWTSAKKLNFLNTWNLHFPHVTLTVSPNIYQASEKRLKRNSAMLNAIDLCKIFVAPSQIFLQKPFQEICSKASSAQCMCNIVRISCGTAQLHEMVAIPDL